MSASILRIVTSNNINKNGIGFEDNNNNNIYSIYIYIYHEDNNIFTAHWLRFWTMLYIVLLLEFCWYDILT